MPQKLVLCESSTSALSKIPPKGVTHRRIPRLHTRTAILKRGWDKILQRTPQVGTASTSGISDADGPTNSTWEYQWMGDDAEIDGATSSTYDVRSSDNGKVIRVRVTFTDHAGGEESLTSAGTTEVVLGGL